MLKRGRPSDEETLMSLIPGDGDSVGNTNLLRQVGERGWSEEKYWQIRNRLLDEGILLRGRGKGGSVRRSMAEPDASVTSPSDPEVSLQLSTKNQQKPTPEISLYEPLKAVLATDWAKEMNIEPDQIHFEITGLQGRKATGGTWTRPDISAVSVRTFEHLPNKYLDIWTFEVKTAAWFDVTAIFEAAAHASRATRSYALLQVPIAFSKGDEELLARCEREADRLRVGLITFTSPSEFKTWETRVEAPRNDTAPEDLESFISQLSDQAKKRLARWK